MRVYSNQFFSGNKDDETLFNRVSLSDDQEEELKITKDFIQSELEKCLREKTGKNISFFIQGSYKNKTLIRPLKIPQGQVS